MIEERLKWARNTKGLSQKKLAETLNPPTSQQAIDRWERGVTAPSLFQLLQLAQILGVSSDYLIGNTEDPIRRVPDDMVEALEKFKAWGLDAKAIEQAVELWLLYRKQNLS